MKHDALTPGEETIVARIREESPPHPFDWATAAVIVAVHVGALFAPWYFSWSGLALMLVLYAGTAMGVTIGFHRLLTHRSFKCKPWVEYAASLCGSLACQGGPVEWVAIHRIHHAHADTEEDPHNARAGFWWAHIGWIFRMKPTKLDRGVRMRFARDLEADGVHRFLDRYFVVIQVLLGALLLELGGWSWVVWGIFVRLTLVYHATWLVNSAAHMWGYQTYRTGDLATNNWWVAALTFGEGWHNNHHAFPQSARQGLAPHEVDPSWLTLRLFEKLGWVWDFKLPSEKALSLRAHQEEPEAKAS